jgi:hypothetical protein
MRAAFSVAVIDLLSLTDTVDPSDQSIGVASRSRTLLVTGQHRATLDQMSAV